MRSYPTAVACVRAHTALFGVCRVCLVFAGLWCGQQLQAGWGRLPGGKHGPADVSALSAAAGSDSKPLTADKQQQRS